ncbi:hypothetical protein CTI14_69315, partial [Methylobacterium radiotolerans]
TGVSAAFLILIGSSISSSSRGLARVPAGAAHGRYVEADLDMLLATGVSAAFLILIGSSISSSSRGLARVPAGAAHGR